MGATERPQHKARRLVPLAEVFGGGMVPVIQALAERGLIEITDDAEAMGEACMELLREQGLITSDGYVAAGQCLLLPHPGCGLFSLLAVTPVPADQYTHDLRRKPSPIRFDRTAKDEIVLPGRWLLARFEEITDSPVASKPLRALALNMSRRAVEFRDLVLPPVVETVAIEVTEKDGTVTTVEALPPGFVVSFEHATQEG